MSRFEQGGTAMTRYKGRRVQLGSLLAVALGALAIFVLPALAGAKDGNDDRIPDRWEKRHRLSLKADQSGRDQDRDHLRNLAEFRAGDNPRDRDSDDDGVMDGEENAGTIASFDAAGGKLVIDLFGNDTIAGLVTDRTKIKCEDEHSSGDASSSREAEPADDHGGRGNEPDDDNGGRGEEADDDHDDGDNSGPGSSNSGPSGHDDNGTGANCTSADLVPGAVVEEAELEIEHGTATFDEVELAHSN
jgi:hypothetical protein